MATEDRLMVISENEFRSSSIELGRSLSASTLDRFFYAAASYLEDNLDDHSAGLSLRRVVEDLLEKLEEAECKKTDA